VEYGQIEKPLGQFFEMVGSSRLLPDKDISGALLADYNFMLISFAAWTDVSENRREALQGMPSTLILSAGQGNQWNKGLSVKSEQYRLNLRQF
jgi:hypothetical protein